MWRIYRKRRESLRGDSKTAAAAPTGSEESEMICGVCLEAVLDKAESRERAFGILPGCNHCFCVTCIRKWKMAREPQSNNCPECRAAFPFYVPHDRWLQDGPEKRNLVERHREKRFEDRRRFGNVRRCLGFCYYGTERNHSSVSDGDLRMMYPANINAWQTISFGQWASPSWPHPMTRARMMMIPASMPAPMPPSVSNQAVWGNPVQGRTPGVPGIQNNNTYYHPGRSSRPSYSHVPSISPAHMFRTTFDGPM